ncbi:MBL fold metallo-hydrolase [Taklimakanibacter albus]|uniref:MBL fold metallo-hydrolase n=1 Tax=Taklimakanibacter albus TaxID=2800327 RepID=A0ACC5R8T6_9HYPH|nr:MBL fold metallo-hydrolase [Aestuariivirga sp. YIM B02566]MBK1869068.1 MBL fold metallo-hydrolase [Aestuariivirga sp. YIM B02566]
MTVKLHFHGATRVVTGSCYVIETDQARLIIDCGMFQGSKTEKELNYRAFPFDPRKIDAMLLTHAHIDHAGLIPKLVKAGFAKKIYATHATCDLCAVMLPDSGFIQETEVRLLNDRNRKRGLPEVEPIYTLEDAHRALEFFEGIAYKMWITPVPGIRARYWNAGHLLGSASIEVEVERAGQKPLRILFSGDIGPDAKLFEPDPEAPTDFDYVVCESTYGGKDRFERSEEKRRELLGTELRAAASRQGAVLIPSFAVERTQEVLVDLIALMDKGVIPNAPVFIDSPLALKATNIFSQHAKSLRNGDALLRALESPYVKTTESVEESKAINRFSGFHIIVAASGMCEAGRIRHHLKNNLFKPNATVLLVGFQAAGTLGRLLEDGAQAVKIHGEEVKVRATIRRFEDYSGHADGPELLQWLRERLPIAKMVFLTHGEESAQIAMEGEVAQNNIMPADRIARPSLDDVYDLTGAEPVLSAAEVRPRISPDKLARRDWHNDLTELMLGINDMVGKAADEKARAVIIRRLKRALEEENGNGQMPPPNGRHKGRDEGKGGARGFDEG